MRKTLKWAAGALAMVAGFELALMTEDGDQVMGLVNDRVAWTLSTDPRVPSGPPILRRREA